jgi:hypothetical protein
MRIPAFLAAFVILAAFALAAEAPAPAAPEKQPAAQQETTPREAAPQAAPEHAWRPGFEAGAEVYNFRYVEPSIMRDHGVMYGPTAAYTWYHDALALRGEGRLAFGQVNYKSPFSGSMGDINDLALELRGLAGWELHAKEVTLTPYAGLAYRYLRDDADGKVTSTGDGGYLRESNYFYSPIGVAAMMPLAGKWSFGATVEYDLFWLGRQESDLSDVAPFYPSVTNHQDDGFGWRGSLRFVRHYEKHDLVLEPFIRYWHIGTSNISQGGYEPDNRTVEAGLMVAVTF